MPKTNFETFFGVLHDLVCLLDLNGLISNSSALLNFSLMRSPSYFCQIGNLPFRMAFLYSIRTDYGYIHICIYADKAIDRGIDRDL